MKNNNTLNVNEDIVFEEDRDFGRLIGMPFNFLKQEFKMFSKILLKYAAIGKIIGKIKLPSSKKIILLFDSVPNKKIISHIKSLDSIAQIVIIYLGNEQELSEFKDFNHLVFSTDNNSQRILFCIRQPGSRKIGINCTGI